MDSEAALASESGSIFDVIMPLFQFIGKLFLPLSPNHADRIITK